MEALTVSVPRITEAVTSVATQVASQPQCGSRSVLAWEMVTQRGKLWQLVLLHLAEIRIRIDRSASPWVDLEV